MDVSPSRGSATSKFPAISAVQWLQAKSVLGGEASDFTPWLAQPHILEILGNSLKLEALTAVAQEHPVLGKRLDILATAEDEQGEEVPVCIENQYGLSDADHLGRLIAYLAQHESGRAVWIVEEAHDAFVAAVRFLNRTSTDEVGYYLVQVRFTHGEGGAYQVHFEVLAAPIAWERPSNKAGGKKPINKGKVEWMHSLYETVRPSILGLGFHAMNVHARGSYIWVRWPDDVWFHALGRNISVRARRGDFLVAVNVQSYSDRDANRTAVQIIEERLSTVVSSAMPDGSDIQWGTSQAGNREQIRVVRHDLGYVNGDPHEAAAWTEKVIAAWLSIGREHPIKDLDHQVELRGGSTEKDLDPDEEDAEPE